jgi:hypothetical protein
MFPSFWRERSTSLVVLQSCTACSARAARIAQVTDRTSTTSGELRFFAFLAAGRTLVASILLYARNGAPTLAARGDTQSPVASLGS